MIFRAFGSVVLLLILNLKSLTTRRMQTNNECLATACPSLTHLRVGRITLHFPCHN